jgi:hypothetical protein
MCKDFQLNKFQNGFIDNYYKIIILKINEIIE